jgi:hypothetical protein
LASHALGTGKTFTMGGHMSQSDDESLRGIIPRAVNDIFEIIEKVFRSISHRGLLG